MSKLYRVETAMCLHGHTWETTRTRDLHSGLDSVEPDRCPVETCKRRWWALFGSKGVAVRSEVTCRSMP